MHLEFGHGVHFDRDARKLDVEVRAVPVKSEAMFKY